MITLSTSTTVQPPLAPGLPWVGSILNLMQDSQGFFFEQYQKLGSVYRVHVLGQELKVLAGPELNLMMATQPDAFTAWDVWEPIVRDFGGKRTLPMLDGAEHSRLRRLMRESFSRAALTDNLADMIEVTRTLLRQQSINRRVSAVPFMQRLTAEQLGRLSNECSPGDHFDDIVLWWNSLLEVHVAHRKPASLLQTPKYQQARDRVKDFARQIFADRQAHRPASSEDNFLDNLADASQQDPDFLSHDEALFLTLAAYFAGLDTVANVSAFMLFELLRHPDLLQRAQEEADQLFADGTPTAEGLRQLDVLHSVALETLRLYPIAGTLPRKAARDFEFGGYHIAKDEFFMAATCATHFTPEIFPNPKTFDIERYAPPRNEHKKRGAFAPFGAGPHTCLGAGLAEAQIMLNIATILHHADLELDPPNYRLKVAYTPSMTPAKMAIRLTAWRG